MRRDIYLSVQVLGATDSNIVRGASPSMVEAPISFIESLLLILRCILLISVQHRCLWPRLLLHSLVYFTSVKSRQVVR